MRGSALRLGRGQGWARWGSQGNLSLRNCGGSQLKSTTVERQRGKPQRFTSFDPSIHTSISVKRLSGISLLANFSPRSFPVLHTKIRLLPTQKNPLPEVPLPWRCGLVKGQSGHAANRSTDTILPHPVIHRVLTIEGQPINKSCYTSGNTPLLRRLPLPR